MKIQLIPRSTSNPVRIYRGLLQQKDYGESSIRFCNMALERERDDCDGISLCKSQSFQLMLKNSKELSIMSLRTALFMLLLGSGLYLLK